MSIWKWTRGSERKKRTPLGSAVKNKWSLNLTEPSDRSPISRSSSNRTDVSKRIAFPFYPSYYGQQLVQHVSRLHATLQLFITSLHGWWNIGRMPVMPQFCIKLFWPWELNQDGKALTITCGRISSWTFFFVLLVLFYSERIGLHRNQSVTWRAFLLSLNVTGSFRWHCRHRRVN